MKRQNPQWHAIIRLSEQILDTNSLAEQREKILATGPGLFGGSCLLWLDENLFHLPGRNQETLFASAPETELMRKAAKTGKATTEGNHRSALALPLKNNNMLLGVLEVKPNDGRIYHKTEVDMYEGLAGHIALALMASHRLGVEKWRIEQLTLVRSVSAQIANVHNLDVLTRRVTRLIQKTFHYYYVAVLTLESGEEHLRLCSSAGEPGRQGRQRKMPVLEVKTGEGLIGTAALTGEEMVVNDIKAEPRFRFLAALPETRAEVALPLKRGKRVLGVLDVQSDQQNGFHPNDLLVLRALADVIATAIEGARLYSDLESYTKRLALTGEVSKEIASILELDLLLDKVAGLIQERLGYKHVHLFSVHPNRRRIEYEGGSRECRDVLRDYRIDLDSPKGLIPWAARNGEMLVVNDVSQEPRYLPLPFPPDDTRSEAVIPLMHDNQVMGILDLQSDQPNAFGIDEQLLFEALADNIAVAMHNIDLYRTERWRRQVADSLREVAGLLSADVSLDDVLDAVLKELQRNLPCDVAAIWLVEGENLHLAHIHGADVYEVEMAVERWPEAGEFLSNVLQAEEPVIRKPTDPFGPTGVALGYAADYSSIATLMRIGDRPLGVLTLSHHTSGRYGHEAKAMTATFASYAAVAIENARLFDNAQEQAYASAALLQVAQTVANSNTLDEILASVVRITPILVGVKGCAIYLHREGHFQPTQAYGFPDEAMGMLMERRFKPGDFRLLDAVREQGRMVTGLLAPEIPEDWLDPTLAITAEETLYTLQTGDHILVGMPLMIKGDLYGVMLVLETAEVRRFRQKRIEIILSICQQVALSIQNEHLQEEMVARERLEQEVEVARQIQRTFLPDHLPEVPGWELAASWKTARQVGGDFYDVFELPGGRLGLFIADVSDKGVPAALFMALTRTLVRAVVYDTPSPGEALRRVNALILPDNQQSMFVTAVYAVLSLESGQLVYANAGHNPPLVACQPDGKIEVLGRSGAALGIIEDLAIEDRMIMLGEGQCVLFYTDGVTEAFSPREEPYGMERLCRLVKRKETESIQELLHAIEKSVEKFTRPMPMADDMTMLGVKRLGGSQTVDPAS